MKVKSKQIFSILFVIFLLFYIAFQAFRSFYRPLKTEIVTQNSVTDSIDTEVYVLRNEASLKANQTGIITPVVNEAQRVAKDQTVVLIFHQDSDAMAYFNKIKYQKELDHIRKIKGASSFVNLDVEKFKGDILNQATYYIQSVSDRDFNAFNNEKSELKDKITLKQILSGENIDTSDLENEINQKLNSIESVNGKYTNVLAPNSGYFISQCDGYESAFDVSKPKELDFDKIKKVLSQPVNKEQTYGKIISDFNWYVFCDVPKTKGDLMQPGAVYQLDFPYTQKDYERPSVKLLYKENYKDKIRLILVGNTMNENIASLRHEKAKIIRYETKGLRINSQALRTNQKHEKGVYVLNGEVLEFKKVDIIKSTEKYAISREHNDDKTYVSIYDNVVLGGKNLYDGKVIG